MYTTIIFDFFDVIRNDPYKRWLANHGIERTGEFAEVSKPLDSGEIETEEFFERLEKLSGHSRDTVAEIYANTELMDEGMPALIVALKNNYKLGLLSNASSDYLRGLLKQHNYEKLFDHVVISGELGFIKPSPEAFHHILEKLGSEPSETIFVDDSQSNVEAASRLGIKGVLFESVPQLKTDLRELGVVID